MSGEASSGDIYVVSVEGEVDVSLGNGPFEPLRPGMVIHPGKQRVRICAGKGANAVVGIGHGVAMIREASLLTIEYEVKGDEVTPKVTFYPGVAKTSVKQLQQFRTDFQVSPIRLTVSVRG